MDTPVSKEGLTTLRTQVPVAAAARVLPSAVIAVIAVLLAWRERGSIAAPDWLPYLVLAALLLAAVVLSGGAVRPGKLALTSAGALLALSAWAAISIAWTPAPSLARDEAFLRLLYAIAFLVPLLTLRQAGERAAAVVVLVLGLGALSIVMGLELRYHDEPGSLYYEGRPYFPISYPNAQAALFLVGFWPAVGLASRATSSLAVRALSLGTAVGLLGGALMDQSKGAAVGLILSALVFFALTPLRLRAFVPAAIAAGLVAPGFRVLTEPIRAEDAALEEAVRTAAGLLLLIAAAGVAAGAVYALGDRRLSFSPRATRSAGVAVAAILSLALAAGVAAFLTRVGDPSVYLGDRWEELRATPVNEGPTHFQTLGSHRWDFWRVALQDFREEPLTGVGSRGFAVSYLARGDSIETPARAHSLPLDVLGEEGVIGAALLAAALLPLLVVALRRGRRAAGAAALAASAVYWFVHASVDWTWTLPAAGLPFFLLLGIMAAADSGGEVRRRPAAIAAAAAVVVALLALAPWLSARFTGRALATPARAESDLRWARRLDPLSIQPYVAEWQLAPTHELRIGALTRAVEREPESFALRYFLGLAYREAGRIEEARRELTLAKALAPRVESVDTALASLQS